MGVYSLLVKLVKYSIMQIIPSLSCVDGIICGILQITVWYIQMTCTNTQSFDNIIETATYTVGLPRDNNMSDHIISHEKLII